MSASSATASSYRLVATDDDKLKGHVGHKVEIIGTLEGASASASVSSPSGSTSATGTTGTATGTTGSTSTGSTSSGTTSSGTASGTSTSSPSYSGSMSASATQNLKVTSVRMVSATCP